MGEIRADILKCTEGYASFNNDSGINQLSKADAAIISVLFEIMIKMGLDQDIEKLLNDYKRIPDKEILLFLNNYNDLLLPRNKVALINIKNQFIGKVDWMESFIRSNYYDYKNNKLVHTLTINKTDNVRVPYANTQIIFLSEEELEREFKDIQQKLSKYSNITFI